MLNLKILFVCLAGGGLTLGLHGETSGPRRAGLVVVVPTAAPEQPKHVIIIKRYKFVPDQLVVRLGETITWVNEDPVQHTATALNGSWNTGEINANGSGRIVTNKVGTVNYYCNFHPEMQGSITVEN